jgi:hypothetical protein
MSIFTTLVNTIYSALSSSTTTTMSNTTTTITTKTEEEEELFLSSFVMLEAARDETAASFTKDEVMFNGDLCSLAYLDFEANETLTGEDYKLSAFATDLSTGFVRTKGCEAIITFKGTSTLRDLATDFTAFPVFNSPLHAGGYLHQGFVTAFESSWPQVQAILESHACSLGVTMADLTYTVNGHSLGGAQATLASLRLVQLVHDVSQVRQVTFGSPRVFSSAIASTFDRLMGSRTLRVAETDVDIVTMVAPGFLGFKHVGQSLTVAKPAGVLPHLMEGYMAGVKALDTSSFMPTFTLGVRRAFFFAIRRMTSF